MKNRFCSLVIELVALGMRPYHFPREFSSTIVFAVYMPPSANAEVVVRRRSPTPQYAPLVQRQPVSKSTVNKWSQGANEESADWDELLGPQCEYINSMTDCVTVHMKF